MILILLLVFVCRSSFGAKQDLSGCQQALSDWQQFRQTQLSMNFANNIAWGDRDAMKALVSRGFIEAGSIRFENRENESRLPSLLQATAQGFLYNAEGFAVRLMPVDLEESEQEASSRRIYIRFRDNLYSAQVSMNHPNLAAFRRFVQGLAQDQALSQALSQPAFRSAGIIATSGVSMLSSGLDAVLRQQVESLISNPTRDAKGLDLAKLLDFAVDPRIFDYQHFEGGKYIMGSPNSEPGCWSNEGPQREVELSPFDLGNHIPQWAVVIWRLATNKLREGSYLLLPYFREQSHSDGGFLDLGNGITLNGNHPGEMLSYNEALEFVDWLSNLPSVKASGCRYNLPSQAQWQYAARYLGPGNMSYNPRPFPESRLGDNAYFSANSGGRTHATGQKQPHPNGLLDMFGNVWVWTLDGWTDRLDAIPNKLDPVVTQGPLRVIVGGSCNSAAGVLCSAVRSRASPGGRYVDVAACLVRHCR